MKYSRAASLNGAWEFPPQPQKALPNHQNSRSAGSEPFQTDQKEAPSKSQINLPPARQMKKRLSPVLWLSGSTMTESFGRSSKDGLVMSQAEAAVRAHSVVEGPSPSIASIPNPTVRISPATDAKRPIAPQRFSKKNATFTVGASASSSEAAQPSKQHRRPASKRMFQLGSSNSSEEGPSLKSSLCVPPFKGHLSSVDSDDEMDDEVDESAIDDDDDSDWEDSEDVSGTPTMDVKPLFRRIPPSTQRVTQPLSLISLGLAAERARRLGPVASQSTSALHCARPTENGSTTAGSPTDSDENPLMMKGAKTAQLQRINEVPRSQAQPINAIHIPVRHQAALSPRATRRHMLSTELTDSLRKHIVWERQYKHSTINAVLKLRHTSNDLADLQQHPEPVYMNDKGMNTASFDQFFWEANVSYHAMGW